MYCLRDGEVKKLGLGLFQHALGQPPPPEPSAMSREASCYQLVHILQVVWFTFMQSNALSLVVRGQKHTKVSHVMGIVREGKGGDAKQNGLKNVKKEK